MTEIPHQQTSLAPQAPAVEPKKPWVNKHLLFGIIFLVAVFSAVVSIIYWVKS